MNVEFLVKRDNKFFINEFKEFLNNLLVKS